jgi:hypothetical protein
VTPREARVAFVFALRQLRAVQRSLRACYQARDPLSLEWQAVLRGAAKETRPRARKLDSARCVEILGEERLKEMRAPFEERGRRLFEDLYARRDLIGDLLVQLAELAEVREGALRLFKVIYPERNQGYGNRRYSRGRAELAAITLHAHGITAVVRGDEQEPPLGVDRGCWSPTFEVWAGVRTQLDIEIAQRKPAPPLREQVRLCWKLGVNPRVYNPWLPHGFEAREGLDFYGNDLREKSA